MCFINRENQVNLFLLIFFIVIVHLKIKNHITLCVSGKTDHSANRKWGGGSIQNLLVDGFLS